MIELHDVWRLYDAHAAAFDRDRGRALPEAAYLREVLGRLDLSRRQILDLGCGSGEPIARYMIEAGCQVTGIDAAPAMLAMCRARFPAMTWIEADMRTLALGRRFDAIIAWDSFFHLCQEDQRGMFAVFSEHVAPQGLLLFTSGAAQGEAVGDLYGHALYHDSLNAAQYRELLTQSGFAVVRHCVEDPDCGGHTVWLAQASP